MLLNKETNPNLEIFDHIELCKQMIFLVESKCDLKENGSHWMLKIYMVLTEIKYLKWINFRH